MPLTPTPPGILALSHQHAHIHDDMLPIHPCRYMNQYAPPPLKTGMGYFLLRESMLDSVIVARDRFLVPGGALYPSHAAIYMAPIRTNLANQRTGEFQGSMEGWAEFLQEMKHYYQVRRASTCRVSIVWLVCYSTAR